MPSVFAPMEIICYCFVEGFLGIASGVLFLINCSSFIFYAVAAAFIFVWSQFLIGFINQTFQGNYSIANWIANLIPFLTIFVAFILNMVLVPSITQIIFGGGAGAAGKIGELAERLAALGAMGGV